MGNFCTISKIFCISCMSVSLSLSLLYPPVGYFWGSTSDTSGLVSSLVLVFLCRIFGVLGFGVFSFWDVCTLIPNNSEFLVCLSVC